MAIEVGPGDRLELAGAGITVGATDHRPVAPTVGYRVEHDGLTAVLAGDTVPCEGLDALFDGATRRRGAPWPPSTSPAGSCSATT